MSVYLKPCTGCPLRNGCEQRDDFRKRVRGLGLRSATFNCDRLKASIAPGTRIVISHPITVDLREDLPATIVSSGVDDFSCVIDRSALAEAIELNEAEGADKIDTYRFRKTMLARRIVRFLDEPKRRICGCGKVVLPDGGCDKKSEEDCWNQKAKSNALELA